QAARADRPRTPGKGAGGRDASTHAACHGDVGRSRIPALSHRNRPAWGPDRGAVRAGGRRTEPDVAWRQRTAQGAATEARPASVTRRDGGACARAGGGHGARRAGCGQARGRGRLLGTSSGAPGRPALQSWLAEDVERPEDAQDMTWVPIEQALDRAGAPGLSDGRTLRALNVVARAGLGTWGL